jgi:hypothetical protein
VAVKSTKKPIPFIFIIIETIKCGIPLTNKRLHQISSMRIDDEYISFLNVHLSMVPIVCTDTSSKHLVDPSDAFQC